MNPYLICQKPANVFGYRTQPGETWEQVREACELRKKYELEAVEELIRNPSFRRVSTPIWKIIKDQEIDFFGIGNFTLLELVDYFPEYIKTVFSELSVHTLKLIGIELLDGNLLDRKLILEDRWEKIALESKKNLPSYFTRNRNSIAIFSDFVFFDNFDLPPGECSVKSIDNHRFNKNSRLSIFLSEKIPNKELNMRLCCTENILNLLKVCPRPLFETEQPQIMKREIYDNNYQDRLEIMRLAKAKKDLEESKRLQNMVENIAEVLKNKGFITQSEFISENKDNKTVCSIIQEKYDFIIAKDGSPDKLEGLAKELWKLKISIYSSLESYPAAHIMASLKYSSRLRPDDNKSLVNASKPGETSIYEEQ